MVVLLVMLVIMMLTFDRVGHVGGATQEPMLYQSKRHLTVLVANVLFFDFTLLIFIVEYFHFIYVTPLLYLYCVYTVLYYCCSIPLIFYRSTALMVRFTAFIVRACQGLTVDVEGFNSKMADEKMKSGMARNNQKASGGKPMVLEAEQVGHVLYRYVVMWFVLCVSASVPSFTAGRRALVESDLTL